VSGSAEAYGDKHRIVQILVNLLNNAISYAPQKSKVSVTLSEDAASSSVAVTDEGRGISPEIMDSAFRTLTPVEGAVEFSGAGLELAICKALVELHKGTLDVESEPGKGATFTFTVPKSPPDGARITTEDVSIEA